jgi:hypothetical protein
MNTTQNRVEEHNLPKKTDPLLEIILYIDERALLPELQKLFPDLAKEKFIGARVYYVASLREGAEGMRQRAFLSKHHLEYRNRTWQCEQSIRAFFSGVEFEGRPIEWVEFEVIPGAQQATIKTAEMEVRLRFPLEWDQESWQQGYGMLGWLYVYDTTEQVCASLVGVERCVTEQIKRTATPDEMAGWLHERGYTQVICTTASPGVFGLYKPSDQ